jgi:hypothetical protein
MIYVFILGGFDYSVAAQFSSVSEKLAFFTYLRSDCGQTEIA